MEIANMNVEYAPAKIVIGTFEFSSEEYGIDSINIINGCYDGSVVGIGAVYSQAVTIEMSFIDGISKGERFSLYFKIHNSWQRYGTFWVDDCPTRNGNKMTINAHGVIGECGNRELIFSGKNQTYTLEDVKDQIESITGCKIIFWPLLDSADINAFLGQKVCFLKEINDFIDGKDIKTGISVRTAIAGLAILFGGNAFEDDEVIRIKAKSYTTKQYKFTKDDYTSDYQYSQFQYAIRSISLSFLPWTLGFYYPPGVSGQICTVDYLGNERVQNLLLGSGITGYTLYDYTIECDWIGWTNDGGVFDRYTPPGGKAKGCYIQGDLIYRTGSFSFPGYNRSALYPGNIISIEVDEEDNAIDLYCGEIELSWDGGFTTKVSCECNIDGTHTSYSASGSTHAEATAAQSAGAVNLQKISFADITFSNVKDSTISGSKFIDGSITGSKFADGSITNSKIADSEITGSKIKDSTLTNALFKDGTIDGSKIKDSTLTNSLFADGTIENSKIKDSTLTGAKIEDATIGFEKVNTSFIEDLTADKAYIDNLNARIGDFGFITADSADLKYATIELLQATDGRIDTLESKAITTDNLEAEVATLGYLSAESADVKFATIESLTAVDGKINTLSSKAITTENLSAEVADLGYLSAESAEIGYAKIDLSNVGTQVVDTSMIKDGAVTNEKVGNLSANKITSGTIDASKINVTNLNADNLTVGTINGKLIGNGSVDLDKLSQEVPTKEYLDNVQKELQGQIDGAIETFTKSEIPTLNNEPASLWTDNETRKKHIGDVCYVLNPASSADGYCYRFANTGTESSPSYEWVLIKDSDVTKALQDIIDINGEITGIKQFDTDISSWKTDTDDELSSLKLRTTTLETDIGSKVESSVFNELKQTVDENSSNITSLSTTVSKKADSSTVTELTNTVNSVKQTSDMNTSSISSMRTEIGKKADGSTVTELSTRTSNLEQNLYGFKTEVSKTYTTKTEFDDLSIGGRNLALQTKDFTNNSKYWYIGSMFTRTVDEDGFNILSCSKTNTTQDGWNRLIPSKRIQKENMHKGLTVSFDFKCDDYDSLTNGCICSVQVFDANNNRIGWYEETSVFDDQETKIKLDRGRINGEWVRASVYFNEKKLSVRFSSYDVVSYATISFQLVRDGSIHFRKIKMEYGNKATDWSPAPEDTEKEIGSVRTIATQTADKFSWLVKSGTSATNFELTDRTANLVSNYINLNGLVTFSGLGSDAQNKINTAQSTADTAKSNAAAANNTIADWCYNNDKTYINGGKIYTGSITAEQIDVSDLFAQDITATGTITGVTLNGVTINCENGSIAGFSIDKKTITSEYMIPPTETFTDNSVFTTKIDSNAGTDDFISVKRVYNSDVISESLFGINGVSISGKDTPEHYRHISSLSDRILSLSARRVEGDEYENVAPYSGSWEAVRIDLGYANGSPFSIQPSFEINIPVTVRGTGMKLLPSSGNGYAIIAADSEGGKLQLQGSGNLYEIDAAGGILRFLDVTAGNELALLNQNGLYPKKELVMAEGKSIRFESVKSPYRIRGTASTITIGDVNPNGNSGCVYIQGDMLVRTGTFEAPTIKEGGVSLSNKYCYYQEGTGSVSGGASWKAVTVAFPVEYKTKPFVMVVQNCATTTENIWVTEVTTQGIAFQMHTPTSGWTYEYRWMAIGIKK